MWGVLKFYHKTLIKAVKDSLPDGSGGSNVASQIQELKEQISLVKKEVTPNGKNTERLGDTVARTETKVDILVEMVQDYGRKYDELNVKVERHLGWHEGEAES